jgi:hypothetical protein
MIARIRIAFPIGDEQADALARSIETRFDVSMSIGAVLEDNNGYEPWLDQAREEIDDYYWTRYARLLVAKGISPQVVASLDSVTHRTLGLLENPKKSGAWSRRGMVVGHVQSGKTSNYIGLISKAADAGYKVIIVIAGIHNNLRNQTQRRIDEGFVGRDSSHLLSRKGDVFVGVGLSDKRRRPITFTNTMQDFSKSLATGLGVPLQSVTEPAVFVIKKNSTTLQNLIEWLRGNSARGGSAKVDIPMLLIDDEADNASINISKNPEEASRINARIRELLQLFERSCYVGYTATPFANIFIDPDSVTEMLGDDLFPRHFIVSLDPPSNYFGASKVFLEAPEQVIRHIDDNEDWIPLVHRIDARVESLPASLKKAIRTYVLARAIRLARGEQGFHSSMLVNVSRFTAVQKQLRNEIHAFLGGIQQSARLHGALRPDDALRSFEIAALKTVWTEEYQHAGISWPEVQTHLSNAASPIRVIEINNQSAERLNYEDHPGGQNAIAVGGLSLSRGLTLEGLVVSYFLRNSMMYDTLMQMGRWFGYRPGYEDLCRIWMPEEAEGWYQHISESIEMLRDELRTMEQVGATPEEFGLKVRAHPDSLIVTARNKMRSAEKVTVQIGFEGRLVETYRLLDTPEAFAANLLAARRLARRLQEMDYKYGIPPKVDRQAFGGHLIQRVPAEPVIQFIQEFQNHPMSLMSDPGMISEYISRNQTSELGEWDVLFYGLASGTRGKRYEIIPGVDVTCQRRDAKAETAHKRAKLVSSKNRVASRGVEKIGLTQEQIEIAEADYTEEHAHKQRQANGTLNFPDYIYRQRRSRPLLIVHHLVFGEAGKPDQIELAEPRVAWSISFPGTITKASTVEFVAGSVYLKEFYGNFDLDD